MGVAESKRRQSMKRILVLLAVVALLMMAVAAPAFARGRYTNECISYYHNAYGYSYADAAKACNLP
jgi:Gpi18-like mannosyltransferase